MVPVWLSRSHRVFQSHVLQDWKSVHAQFDTDKASLLQITVWLLFHIVMKLSKCSQVDSTRFRFCLWCCGWASSRGRVCMCTWLKIKIQFLSSPLRPLYWHINVTSLTFINSNLSEFTVVAPESLMNKVHLTLLRWNDAQHKAQSKLFVHKCYSSQHFSLMLTYCRHIWTCSQTSRHCWAWILLRNTLLTEEEYTFTFDLKPQLIFCAFDS